ncbi:MAG: hypothetical protein IT381_04430 [Deltaproteobacteria bacterium]|nr:hypothetical protein [Deltaproteobacteria bacterium]
MVRTVSGASGPPQKAEKAAPLSGEKAVKALGTDEKLLDAQVAIAESLAKARAVDAPPVAASGPRDLGASKDVIAKLEAFAKTMSAQVKARPMAQDVAAPFPIAPRLVPAPVLGAIVVLHHRMVAGEIAVAAEHAEMMQGMDRALATQLDASAVQHATVQGEARAQLEVFTDKARHVLAGKESDERGRAELQTAWRPLSAVLDAHTDVVALAQIVMLACAKDHERDLKDVLDAMKDAATKKRELRALIADTKAARTRVEAEIRAEYQARTALDPLNTLFVDATAVSFDQYAKDRDIAGSGPALALTNALKIYPKKAAAGEASSFEALEAPRTKAIDDGEVPRAPAVDEEVAVG